ncbi:E3 SUMO-protein ligase ZBED1-like [Cotesia typhae]|uniref:E3 SUMO-protein ligase ZBED1-like n=1 Tax=Cotesia typhae TaxID=2053667 RepID=UPI003D687063
MIARFLDLRNPVSEILIRHKTAPPMLTGMELTILTSLLNILRPLEAATKEISSDKYCSSSKVIPLVHCMISKLKNLVIEESLIKEVQKRILTEINRRMGAIEQVSSLAIATILDPRFKKLHFEDPLACANAVSKIKDMLKKNQHDECSTVESDSDSSDKISLSSDLWSDHHKLVQRNWKTNKTDESLSDELSLYLRAPVSRFNDNPLEVWADYKIQFPMLYNVAFKYLTMVASSVPSERLFSKAAQVLTQQRSRLQAKRVNKILFLQGLEKKYWDL